MAESRQIPIGGTGSAQTGDFAPSAGDGTQYEFPTGEDSDEGPDPYDGTISLSNGVGRGPSVASGKKAKSNPTFNFGFEGLNHYQQRYSRGGNQFSVEPPDQGMCVGNGYVVEAVNDVLNVYSQATGASALPDNTSTNIVSGFPRNVNHAVDLNSFYGYAPAIDRAHGNIRGPFVTDPTCLYDAQTQRFFLVVLTLEVNPTTGAFTFVNHLDLAVSQTSDPTGAWNIYRIDVTNDGTNTGGANPGPFLGDYPHIGADANGIYLTTNAYPWCCNGFSGAQIYALSKAQLGAGAANVTMQHIDTSGMVNAPSDAGSTQPGFTVWPAQSPGTSQFNLANNGTEYLLSSNAADEAQKPVADTAGTRTSNQLIVWTLTNTASLNGVPNLSLSNRILTVGQYGVPPKQQQPGSGTAPTTAVPQGFCLNDETTLLFNGQTGCWKLLVSATAHARGAEVISRPDSNDTRMQQVMYANGKVWGALDTALNPDDGAQRAGIAWYIVNPDAGSIVKQGYLGASGYDFTYPAIGVTASGRGVMAFTATGDTLNPSAAYAPIDASAGVGAWNVVTGGTGAAQDDGFTSYKQQVGGNPPRTRWGDYGAAAVDGNSIWIASEYIAHTCNYTGWGGPFFAGGTGDNLLGTCAGASHGPGPRSALAQLVDADQQADAVRRRRTDGTRRGRPQRRPRFVRGSGRILCRDARSRCSGGCRRRLVGGCGHEPERPAGDCDPRPDRPGMRRQAALRRAREERDARVLAERPRRPARDDERPGPVPRDARARPLRRATPDEAARGPRARAEPRASDGEPLPPRRLLDRHGYPLTGLSRRPRRGRSRPRGAARRRGSLSGRADRRRPSRSRAPRPAPRTSGTRPGAPNGRSACASPTAAGIGRS
jgi:hypothetical protein